MEGQIAGEILGRDLPLRLVLPTVRPTKPYRVTAHYDQICKRGTHIGAGIELGHAGDCLSQV